VGVEPRYRAGNAIALVGWLGEFVAFVFVDDQGSFDAKCLEGVPEFVGLRRRAFAVTVAYQDQRGRFGFLDVGDRGALGVDLRIFRRPTCRRTGSSTGQFYFRRSN